MRRVYYSIDEMALCRAHIVLCALCHVMVLRVRWLFVTLITNWPHATNMNTGTGSPSDQITREKSRSARMKMLLTAKNLPLG